MQDRLERSIDLYLDGMSMLKVAAQTGIGFSTLQRHLNHRQLTRSNKQNSRKYDLDHCFFEKIDSENKAYWLGFLYADGYVIRSSRNQKIIGLAISSVDIDHMIKFQRDLSATYPIKEYFTSAWGAQVKYCRLNMTSSQMFDNLVSNGVVENKSLILKFPTERIVPHFLLDHFVRGYFDGDGSLAVSKRSTYSIKVCGTKEFLSSLAGHWGKPNLKLQKRHKDDKNNYMLEIGGKKQVKKIADSMYLNSSIHLERKYCRYSEL